MKTALTYILAGVLGFVSITIAIAGVTFIPIFYECRIAETAACMYERNLPPEAALIAANPRKK